MREINTKKNEQPSVVSLIFFFILKILVFEIQCEVVLEIIIIKKQLLIAMKWSCFEK
jgi:hypothetical protein